jgi:hypothetical protein
MLWLLIFSCSEFIKALEEEDILLNIEGNAVNTYAGRRIPVSVSLSRMFR